MRVGKTPRRTTKLASYLLTVPLVLGFPGPGLVHGATAATTPSPSGSLSVETDPAGATVLVDGQSWGTTPVALRPIAPGDHRVRVVKPGYLDNSRVVSVQAGQVGRVQVKLTPHGEQAAVRAQVDTTAPPKKTEGSGKKWALIGAGVAVAGVATYVVVTKNEPPVAGTIAVSPSGVGLAGATRFSFTSQGARDPNNDRLSFNWSFGDGGNGTGETVTHAYSAAGSYTVTLTVSDGKKTAAPVSQGVTVQSVTGRWSLTGTGLGASTLDLSQSGSSISGLRTSTTVAISASVSGSVADPRRITLTSPGTPPTFFYCPFSAELTANETITNAVGSRTFASPCSGSGTLSISR